LFKTLGRYVAPPDGLSPPSLWGSEDHLRQLFGPEAASIRATPRIFNFRYASPAHWIQVFRDYYGPLTKAFGALDPDGQQALEADIVAMLERFNVAGDASLVAPAEYLEAVIVKRLPEVLH